MSFLCLSAGFIDAYLFLFPNFREDNYNIFLVLHNNLHENLAEFHREHRIET